MKPALALLSSAVIAGGIAVKELSLSSDSQKQAGCKGGCDSVRAWVSSETQKGFKSRPEKSVWQDRLEQIVRKGAEDACHPDIMATWFTKSVGLGSRMNGFADELVLALYRGHSFSLCDSADDKFVQRIWAPHFENAANFATCKSKKAACNYGNKQDSLHTVALLLDDLKKADHEYIDDLKHFLYPYVWKYSKATQARVDMALRAAGLAKGQPYLAVHVRRGDKAREADALGSDTYAKAIRPMLRSMGSSLMRAVRRELHAGNISQLYVSTDDESAVQELQAGLGTHVRIVTQPRVEKDPAFATRDYDSEEELMAVLVDIEGLRRAHAFVGTASSNIGRLVYFLRPRSSKSMSLDDDGDWLKRSM